ncbi:DUF3343 domain-containing protein [Gaopeijia maritima]|uniref:DUF3343 domain-containing protein n=1 Tax=Gaopeijia maritima TaxID=3119007 RepID=A0ABU9EBS3_9BACT
MSRALFLFPSTHMAMWAEEVAEEASLPAELVPAPPGSEALCDLALQTFDHLEGAVRTALVEAGVDFTRPAASPPPTE